MRITGGEFRGRMLRVPKTDAIRPTQDRVREALFNIIRGEIAGARFLDLFAGSGAVGLEALSRGAAAVTFVERDRRHAAAIGGNLRTIAGARAAAAEVVAADAHRWLAGYAGPGYGVAFADPPYALCEAEGAAWMLSALAERGAVAAGGLFAAETPAAAAMCVSPGWEPLRDRVYGKTRICLWRRNT
ncbi:MAG: 16S rRNA (guanine(966)-N(2))-methyltransferase RsmD [Kiritimatiellae bacterium]|nr:16S rRNA (guanine(966)-N(2))-methyltransferase RsmD [Kiritimatiellia bacterium]